MIYQELVRNKKIKDPLFSSVKKYLENQLALVITEGKEEDIKVAKQRYENLKPMELQIEPGVTFDNGQIRACVVSRSRGFFHADALIEKVDFNIILKDLGIGVNIDYSTETLIPAIKSGLNSGIYYLTDTKEYVLVLNETEITIEEVNKLFNNTHWYEMTLTIPDIKDPVTERSGGVLIKSINMNDKFVPIYYKPHLE